MVTFSLFVSLISLAVAVSLAVVVVRMRREEQRRSDARVAALSQMATADFLPEPEVEIAPSSSLQETSAGLFAEPQRSSPWGARFAIAGALVFVVLAVLVIGLLRSPSGDRATISRHAEAAAAPLELVALGHAQNGDSLTVTGRVQNPGGSQPVSNLTATVFLFGQDGAFLMSGRSPLDLQTLAGGDQSAFSVTIRVNGAVARYRVSFRDSNARAVAHVDKRNASAALARTE
jgi:hypothetical protein